MDKYQDMLNDELIESEIPLEKQEVTIKDNQTGNGLIPTQDTDQSTATKQNMFNRTDVDKKGLQHDLKTGHKLTEDRPIVAYLQNLSPIKQSQRKNLYFDMSLQTKDETYRTVCFSPEKHALCKAKFESSSPIKLTKFQLKRNLSNTKDEIIINKRLKLDDPSDREVDFDFKQMPKTNESKVAVGITDVASAVDGSSRSIVNVAGRVTFQGFEETIQKNGKTLRKQEGVLTDNTASIRIVLWESDINKILSGSHYTLSAAVVREYDGDKYITLNRKSVIKEESATISREDEIGLKRNIRSVQCPAEGVDSVKRFLSCNRCQVKLAPTPGKNIVKCSECGLTQVKTKCKQRLLASVLFEEKDENSTITLLLFDDKLKQLVKIYYEDNDGDVDFNSIDDDMLMEIILTVEATVYYNAKRNVVSIAKR